jgi:hypothetical protein
MLRCGGCVSAIELNHLDPPRLDGFANPILNLSWPPAAHRICGSFPVLFSLHGGHGLRPAPGIRLRPLSIRGTRVTQSSGEIRRESAKLRLLLFEIQIRQLWINHRCRPGQARKSGVPRRARECRSGTHTARSHNGARRSTRCSITTACGYGSPLSAGTTAESVDAS